MPRRVQDIIPGNRRTIRDIPVERVVPKATKEVQPEKSQDKRDKEEPVVIRKPAVRPATIRRMPITPPPELSRPSFRPSRRFIWIVSVIGAVVVLAGIAFALSGHLAKATFTIVPRSIVIPVSGTYVIPATPTSTTPLSYKVITIVGSASTTVPAVLGANTETKSTGTVTMYNAYSSQSQRMVAGTRLSDDSGRIYRLTSSVIVPGYSSSAGNTIPGTVSADIIADQPGASYNISRSDSISDFKIVAYKGTSKYSGFYARLSSDVTGGFSGAKSTVTPGMLASTTASLQASLSANLLSKISVSVPAEYTMYEKAITQSFDTPSVVSTGSTTASVTITGTLWGIILKDSDLATMLAGATTTSSFGSSSYDTPGMEALSFSIANLTDFYPAKKSPLVAKISGSFKLVGSVPVDAIKKAMVGVSLAQTGAILNKYSQVIDINDSLGEITPLWVTRVPGDISRITVNVSKP
jgi:hypothetical protein